MKTFQAIAPDKYDQTAHQTNVNEMLLPYPGDIEAFTSIQFLKPLRTEACLPVVHLSVDRGKRSTSQFRGDVKSTCRSPILMMFLNLTNNIKHYEI